MKVPAAALAAVLVAGCTAHHPAATPTPAPSPTATPAPTPSPVVTPRPPTPTPVPSAPCPTSYAAPDPHRPRVTLSFAVAADHASVTGAESLVFTPDLPVREVVLRLWANEPASAGGGGEEHLVGRSTVDGVPVTPVVGRDRTLVRLPLAAPKPAGRPVAVAVRFALRLPSGANERLGHHGRIAWFGSGFPLLAWERGHGWATEPATGLFAEAATSEAFRLDLRVAAPAGDAVLATGVRAGAGHFTAAAVRDVAVATGPFRVARGTVRGGMPVTVGVAPGLPDDPARLVRLHVAAIAAHAARYGPYPFGSLDVVVLPDVHGGIEFPSAIMLGTGQDRDATLVHEVAHEWFYGLVGNDQGRDPWLDEAFATYAEALVRGTGGRYAATAVPAAGRHRVGRPMAFWERYGERTYYRAVYLQGAAALLEARRRAGPAAWDRALRCYVAASAYRVARPADLARALRGLPVALAVLRGYGALPPG